MNKKYFQQLLGHANSLHQQGDLKGAQVAYRQILKDFPENPDVLHLLGLTYAQGNQFDQAVDWIKKAVSIRPDITTFQYNLGEAHTRLGNFREALICYKCVNDLDSTFAQGYFGQANIYKRQGAYHKAIELYLKAVEVNPEFFQAYYNLGNTEQELGNYKSAMIYYNRCLKINDKHALAHNNMGIVMQYWDRPEEAIKHYKKAVEINPDFVNGHVNLAKIYSTQGETGRTKKYYLNLSKLLPNDPIISLASQTISPIIFETNQEIDDYHRVINQAIDQYSALPFKPGDLTTSCYHTFSDLVYHGRSLIDFKKQYAQKFLSALPDIPKRKPNIKPHIGFVVTEGHEGVFIKCMRGVINQMNTDKFKITIVCSQPNGKIIIQPTIENQNVGFLEIPKQFDRASQIILDARFDILNYWEIGTDTMNYFLPFLRLAVIQCTSWGWPTTSGIPNVDYYISSKHLEIPNADKYYSEKLIRLNRIPVFYDYPPVPGKPKPLSEYGLSTGQNYYFCAQNLKKVHPDFDEIVLGILDQDANAVILFIEDKQSNITHKLQKRLTHCVSDYQDRIKFLNRMSEVDYLGLLKQVDIALDTLHYGGGANTCYDAFVSGTPMVTLPGLLHSSRYTYAAYQQIEIEDCIAVDVHDYISKAVKIANDDELRTRLSESIKSQVGKLLHDQIAVNELSAFFENIHQYDLNRD